MFKEDDLVVYPGCGIGKILKVEEKDIAGTRVLSYICKIVDKNTEFIIPQTSANKIGLRKIIASTQVEQVFAILQKPQGITYNGAWNKRYKEYTERLKSGDIFELARLLRELYDLSKIKPLSFGERKLFDQAKQLIVTEIAYALGKPEEDVEEHLNIILQT